MRKVYEQHDSAQLSSAQLIRLKMRSISLSGQPVESVAVWQTLGLDVAKQREPYQTFEYYID